MSRRIYVHPNNITICDDINFEYLNQYNWQILKNHTGHIYTRTTRIAKSLK